VTAILDMPRTIDGYHDISGVKAVIRAFDAFSLPLLRWFDPEDATAWRSRACGCCADPAAPGRPKTVRPRVRAEFSNPIGMAQASTRARKRPTRCCGSVLDSSRWLCDAKAAGWQSEAALFRLERDEASSTAWVLTMTAPTWCCGGRRRAPWRHRRRQCRGQQGFADASPIMSG